MLFAHLFMSFYQIHTSCGITIFSYVYVMIVSIILNLLFVYSSINVKKTGAYFLGSCYMKHMVMYKPSKVMKRTGDYDDDPDFKIQAPLIFTPF